MDLRPLGQPFQDQLAGVLARVDNHRFDVARMEAGDNMLKGLFGSRGGKSVGRCLCHSIQFLSLPQSAGMPATEGLLKLGSVQFQPERL